MSAKTLYDKIWDDHYVTDRDDGSSLMYIDRHLIHEVTSPQAFEGLRENNLKPRRASSILATPDHNVPTTLRESDIDGIEDPISKLQVVTLDQNCNEFGINQFKLNDLRQGIVHVIGPEQGLTLPGMTIVCGDSHTSTHGAFGSLAMGIGTSEVEHVLATQCLVTQKQKNMMISVNGKIQPGVTAKDITMFIIGQIGTAGGTGHVIEYAGEAITSLSMEGRMTLCNMAIEAGARAGMVSPDQITFDYVKGKPLAPRGETFNLACSYWKTLTSDENALFDVNYEFDGNDILPQVTWGTSPEMVVNIDEFVPDPKEFKSKSVSNNLTQAMNYMGLTPGTRIKDIELDQIFIGSCTNSRIEDLREAAKILKDNKISKRIKRAIVVPGSGLVKKQAEIEGLDEIFLDAGFEWRDAGCSMCLGMNPDQLNKLERCASTSNRNFEGRQGYKGRTHLVSPTMAALASLEGKFSDIRKV
jgi:3-isopropylmalate/(R)-2-methylmalate dehydratase large subunit